MSQQKGFFGGLRRIVIGKSKDLGDQKLFHNLSLIAVFAWVGLGADGLSSSCYGPEEIFKALGDHSALSLFVALAALVTIVVICASYAQIIELFPSGGGGYLVASKLLSPQAGVVSGCALLVDYILTVTTSVASGGDALFSILPAAWLGWKLKTTMLVLVILIFLNLRGVKESVMLWAPVFFLFVLTHAIAILFGLFEHASALPALASRTWAETRDTSSSVGIFGLLALVMKAYSMGAGTYTGIEAVSNGLPVLREPRVQTGKKTMVYMGASLGITVAGLLVVYLLYNVHPVEGSTLNAELFKKMTSTWAAPYGSAFTWLSLASEAALLFIAAQTGFLDGPRVLANMALDRWFPTRFANLSDRFVAGNGVVLIGVAALIMMAVTKGSVDLLVVLYSINVFITFSMSQLGMVRHWWQERSNDPKWAGKLAINGLGLVMTSFILVTLCVIKFKEGGWVTLVVTSVLVAAAFAIKSHYQAVRSCLKRLDVIVEAADVSLSSNTAETPIAVDPRGRTAVILVNGYNGLGLHTLLNALRLFGGAFKNLVFVEVGAVDAGNFKGASEIAALRDHVRAECERYAAFARARGYGAEVYTTLAPDPVDAIVDLAMEVSAKLPNSVFFGGQLLFEQETWMNRWLHNHTIETLRRKFHMSGLPFVSLPIRVSDRPSDAATAT
jgi:amino acid transporter